MKNRKTTINSFGFTLIEVLVTTAVIGILAVLSSAILINTIRNSNKANITNEAKENIALIAEYLERDVRSAKRAVYTSGTQIQLISDDSVINWYCEDPGGSGNNKYISREVVNIGKFPITNRDPSEGVNVTTCLFRYSGVDEENRIVNLDLVLEEGAKVSSGSQDLGVRLSQTITAFTRNY